MMKCICQVTVLMCMGTKEKLGMQCWASVFLISIFLQIEEIMHFFN